MKTVHLAQFLVLTLCAPAWCNAASNTEPAQPEQGYEWDGKEAVVANDFMIVAAHPLAARSGYEVLENGGSAVDAMVATQMMLNLVEPQSSGIGGGAFLVYWDQNSRTLHTFDGRETAPMSITPNRFLDAEGTPLPWWQRITGGGSVGVPGTLKLLETVHQRFGRTSWQELLEPAIRLGRDGFMVSPRLSNAIADAADRGLTRFDTTREYFFNADGTALAAGSTLKNAEFADTLEHIAQHGSKAFYHGEIAQDIVDTVNHSRPESISLDDLARYQVIERPAVCAPYRRFQVCGMGPPSSGATTVGQILGILESWTPPAKLDASAVHYIAEAQKLAYADRAQFLADSDFVPVPLRGLLDPDYLAERASLIDPERAMPLAEAGKPPLLEVTQRWSPDVDMELAGTSHISIVDRYGNVLSMTTTIESGFGSRLMTRGFLLNNELTDFSALPEEDGRPVANRIEPGKRPRSSMAPTIVFDVSGNPVLVAGSPGGSRIINYVAGAIIAVIDLGLDPQQAASSAHAGNRNGATELEANSTAEKFREPLQALGHEISISDMNSGLHLIAIMRDGTLVGGADPRREGIALGD